MLLTFSGEGYAEVFSFSGEPAMETGLREAMTAGVLVEFFDAWGNTAAQAVFTGWHGRPVPAVGDWLSCEARPVNGGASRTVRGRVRARTFDVQYDDDEPCVWCRLEIELLEATPARRPNFRLPIHSFNN